MTTLSRRDDYVARWPSESEDLLRALHPFCKVRTWQLYQLNGLNMPTVTRVLTEFAAELHFPDYFGHNSAAFEECITDLSWDTASGYCIVITHSETLLANEPDEIDWLIGLLRRAGEEWATPVETGEAWDRPSKPFWVILQYSPIAALTSCLMVLPVVNPLDLTTRASCS